MSEFSHDVQNTPLLNIQDEEISPWVTIQHRSIKAPNGQVEVYHNFKQADYTSLVSLTTDQKLVLVRQYRPAVDSYTIELPGGLAEENENLAVGVARELTEETGYVAPKLPILLSTTRPDNGRLNNWLHGFFVDNVEFDSLIDVEEGIESFVATVDDVCDMINQVHIHSTLHICLILQAAVQGYWPELLEAILDHKLEMKKMLNIPEGYSDRQICVMGLGYVGLTMAVVMADIGFEVTGVEIREKVVNDLKNGIPHFHEPGLQGRLRNVIRTGNLVPVQRIPSPSKSSVYIITVGTPLVGEKEVRLDMIQNVTKEIAEHLKDGDMIIMRSTVRPGTTRKYVLPILEATGKKFDLVFCPERTLEGQALAELRYLPQIVGGVDADARVRATRMFNFITPTVVQVSDAETAEMIKLIDNSQRDVQFALSNEIARMSDKIGISAAEVISAGKLAYPRTNLPFPGPVGGPCLEKDSYILEDGIKDYGLRPDIIMTARTVNEIQPAESAHYIKKLCDKLSIEADRMVITLVGLAFKGRPETDDLRGTMAYPILRELRNAFPTAKFRGFDAIVENDVIRQEFDIEPVDSLEEAFEGSSLVVVANNHKIFELCPLRELSESMYGPAVIYDFWNHFSNASLDLPKSVVYTGLGKIGQTLKSLETL